MQKCLGRCDHEILGKLKQRNRDNQRGVDITFMTSVSHWKIANVRCVYVRRGQVKKSIPKLSNQMFCLWFWRNKDFVLCFVCLISWKRLSFLANWWPSVKAEHSFAEEISRTAYSSLFSIRCWSPKSISSLAMRLIATSSAILRLALLLAVSKVIWTSEDVRESI